MTSSPGRSPPPDAPVADADIEEERSSIRPRHKPVASEQRVMAQAPGSGSTRGRRRVPSQPGTPDERVSRIDQKIRIARILLEDLPPEAPSARLLRVAVVRRDEVLLDGILEGLQAQAKAASSAPSADNATTGVRKRRDDK